MILDKLLSNDSTEITTCKICNRKKLFRLKGTVKSIYIELDKALGEIKYLLNPWIIPNVCNTCLSQVTKDVLEEIIYEAPLIPFKTVKISNMFIVKVGNIKIIKYKDKSELEVMLFGLEERLQRLTMRQIESFEAKLELEEIANSIKTSNFYWSEILKIRVLRSIVDRDLMSKEYIENIDELISYFVFTEGLECSFALNTYNKRGIIVNAAWDKAVISKQEQYRHLGKINNTRGKFTKKGSYISKHYVYKNVLEWVKVIRDGKLGVSLKYGKRFPLLVLQHRFGSIAWLPAKIKK